MLGGVLLGVVIAGIGYVVMFTVFAKQDPEGAKKAAREIRDHVTGSARDARDRIVEKRDTKKQREFEDRYKKMTGGDQ